MLFTTYPFFIFLPSLTLVYFLLPLRYRRILLLAASYYFYMFVSPKLIVYLLAVTLLSYAGGLAIGAAGTVRRKKALLAIFIPAVLSMLIVLKYLNFLIHTALSVTGLWGGSTGFDNFSFILPVGISFYTLQAIGYIIDVYRQKIAAEKSILTYALFVAFFPQILSGPIGRAPHLMPQLLEKSSFDYDRTVEGLKLMAFGFFKKLVIADRLAIFVNSVFNNAQDHTGLPLIIASILFLIQLFCDFSGYTDIATGAARILGINLMKNFDIPLHSRSSPELWRRWHISLSTWFRDYLYIPLGGNRVSKARQYYNMFVTFLVSGLWHGANLTFALWGSLCGLSCILSIIFRPLRVKIVSSIRLNRLPALHGAIQVITTFLLAVLCFVPFRANSINDVFHVYTNLFNSPIEQSMNPGFLLELGLDRFEWGIAILSILIMELIHLYQKNESLRTLIDRIPQPVRYAFYYFSVMFILFFSIRESSGFIYFQF
ncbi:MAG: MBOAT family protein [Spirochaetes bacterium]|nr:MBOAT family protein [Spirochaetota bacterium]